MDQSSSTSAPDTTTAQTAGDVSISNPERLAVKIICASDILKNVVELAQKLNTQNSSLKRYICQANMLLMWKRGSGVLKMTGSVAKIVSSFMLVASCLNPRIKLALRVAHRLWKIGTSVKLINAIANVMKELWQTGCRQTLLEFTHSASLLTRNLSVFGEVLRDLSDTGDLADATPSHLTAQRLLNAIRKFIPAHQIPYAAHIINMALGNNHYSPLFTFTALNVNNNDSSSISRVLFEIESLNFPDFVENSQSEALIMIGSFLHVSRELFDFLDGFQQLTEHDCRFLQDCLRNLTEESANIMRVVSVLVSLDDIRRTLTTESQSSLVTYSLYDARGSAHSDDSACSLAENLSADNPIEKASNSTCTTSTTQSKSDAITETSTSKTCLSTCVGHIPASSASLSACCKNGPETSVSIMFSSQ